MSWEAFHSRTLIFQFSVISNLCEFSLSALLVSVANSGTQWSLLQAI